MFVVAFLIKSYVYIVFIQCIVFGIFAFEVRTNGAYLSQNLAQKL